MLYVVGNDQLKGFGVSLTVGLIISLFTSLYMTRLMFDFWAAKGWLTKLSMLRFFSQARTSTSWASLLLVHGHGRPDDPGRCAVHRPLPDDLNIDFVGGTAYGGQLTREASQVRCRAARAAGEENQKHGSQAQAVVMEIPTPTRRIYQLCVQG